MLKETGMIWKTFYSAVRTGEATLLGSSAGFCSSDMCVHAMLNLELANTAKHVRAANCYGDMQYNAWIPIANSQGNVLTLGNERHFWCCHACWAALLHLLCPCYYCRSLDDWHQLLSYIRKFQRTIQICLYRHESWPGLILAITKLQSSCCAIPLLFSSTVIPVSRHIFLAWS